MGKQKGVPIRVVVTLQTKEWIEQAKNDGHAKGSFFDDAIWFARYVARDFFWSKYEPKTTHEEVLTWRNMIAMRKDLKNKGASEAILAGLDEAIKFQKQQLVDSLESDKYKEIKKQLEESKPLA